MPSSEQRRRRNERRPIEDPQHGPSVGDRAEPRATEKSADLRGAADAADASDDPGEPGPSLSHDPS